MNNLPMSKIKKLLNPIDCFSPLLCFCIILKKKKGFDNKYTYGSMLEGQAKKSNKITMVMPYLA